MDDHTRPLIICYMGGTCGDLISAMIDPRDSDIGKKIQHCHIRQQLKKPNSFQTDDAKDLYLKQLETKTDYKSISSHDFHYHIRKKHSFIGICCDDFTVALTAANRFKNLHRPSVWESVKTGCGVHTVSDYAQMIIDFSNLTRQHTNKIVQLESIFSGSVLSELNEIVAIQENGENVYRTWLHFQKNNT